MRSPPGAIDRKDQGVNVKQAVHERAAGATPTQAELVARAQALVPMLRERAAATEANRRISDEVARTLIDAGFFNIVMPAEAGGYAMRHSALWEVARQIGRGCASTGWILGLIGISPWIVGLFTQRAQKEVFGSGNPIVPVMTGGVGRGLQVTQTGDEYEVSGTWHYGTGIDLCEWAIVMAPLASADPAGRPDARLFILPKHEFDIDHTSWNVLGMRGTGSKNVQLNRARVPGHRSISWTAAQAGEFPGAAISDNPMYQMPLNAVFAMSVVAPIVGAASGAVDHAVSLLRGRFRQGTSREQKGESFSQIEIGQSAATVEMAFALLMSDADEMYETVAAGRPFSIEERARYRAHCSLISRTVLQAVDRLAALAGGSLIQSGSAIERSFRDLHAMTTHFLMQPDVTGEVYGRALLGLELPENARI